MKKMKATPPVTSSIKHHRQSDVLKQLSNQSRHFTIGVTGDVHLLHPRVPSRRVIQHLQAMLTPAYLKQIDLLVINGDLFDRRADVSSEELNEVLYWMQRLTLEVAAFDVTLIVMEGTRSHDHGQPRLFSEMNQWARAEARVIYVKELSVLDLGKGFVGLFIPDELNRDAEVTRKQVAALLESRGLSQVDLTFIHGQFGYQLPITSISSHDETYYQSITQHRIVINHIHTPSQRGIIRAPGSLVRLKHGEEETKGHYLVTLSEQGEVEDWFIETENNVVFKTLDVTGLTFAELSEVVQAFSETHERGSHLRLRMTRQCPSYPSLKELYRNHAVLKMTVDFTDSSVTDLGVGEDLIEVESVSITDELIQRVLRERVGDVFKDNPKALAALESLLAEEV